MIVAQMCREELTPLLDSEGVFWCICADNGVKYYIIA